MTGEAQRLLLLLILQAQLQHVLNAAVGAQSVGQLPSAGAIEPRWAVALLQAQDAEQERNACGGYLASLSACSISASPLAPSARLQCRNRSGLHSAYQRCCGGMWSGSVV